MHCPWCGKERDESALVIHHCGSTDRPPAYCMQCGTELATGAAACGACGLAAGEKPTPVAAGARLATAAAVATPTQSPTGAPAVPPTTGAQRPVAAPLPAEQKRAPQAIAVAAVDHRGTLLRRGIVAAAAAGVCSFFIPWGIGLFGIAGITLVERSHWSWWTPPSAQLLFICFLAALAIGVVGYRTTANWVDAIETALGVALCVLFGRWLWFTRHRLDSLTGLWLTVGAAVVLAGFAIASVARDRSA